MASCALLAACSTDNGTPPKATKVEVSPDTPIAGIGDDLVRQFRTGDTLFETPLRAADGLGPLYIRHACASCHEAVLRGPGLVQKMARIASDGFTPLADQSELAFGHTIRPLLAGGGKTPLLPPPGDTTVMVTTRVGPPLIGHGYMDAVMDSEIERVAAEQSARTDGIHGRINRVTFDSTTSADPRFSTHVRGDTNLIGRFGLKARNATVDDFIAQALLLDIGITSPMRPDEMPNPDGLSDDAKPGVDVDIEHVRSLATYVRLLAIPPRENLDARGQLLFEEVKCSVCHVPALKTRADYPIAALANIEAPVYTDFLLHRWSEEAGDGIIDGTADSREWRTSPLIGMRYLTSFLHDGRAHSLDEAILMHAGEPTESVLLYARLSAEDRRALQAFVGAL